MPTETYTETYDTVGQHSLELPAAAQNIHVTLEGAGGGPPENGDLVGGSGGYWEGDLDLAGETLDIWVGEGGGTPTGGASRHDGGDGDDRGGSGSDGGGGGGSTEIVVGGTMVAAADAGGGAGALGSGSATGGAGGGGARGGAGAPTDDGTAGDGEGGGFGGDGGDGDYGDDASTDGEYGGQEVNSDYLLQEDARLNGGGAGEGGDGSVTVTYDVEVTAAEDLSVDETGDAEATLSWTVTDPDASGQRLYRDTESPVDPNTATEVADLAPDTESYTDTPIDNGTTHHYAVETYATVDGDDDTTALSNEASGQTSLPDVETFSLDASVHDELTAEIPETLNAGQYRIRWKQSDEDGYPSGNEATVGYDADPLEHTISPVLDGEEYDVRIRTETDELTGEWHTASEITKLVPASGITFEGVGTNTIDAISWTLESDFDGDQLVYLARDDYAYDDSRGELVGTVSDTAESLEDVPGVHPGRTYTVTVVAQTQYVHADVSESVTTDSAGLAQQAAPPRGWYSEVSHPDASAPITPQLLDDATRHPAINGLPRAELPVPRDDKWHAEAFDDAPLRVWHDGAREPIERLDHRAVEPGRTVLEGCGGIDLERRVIEDVQVQPTHDLAADLIDEYTGYAADVDEPLTEDQATTILEAAAAFEYDQAILESLLEQITDGTYPLAVTADGIEALQTCWFFGADQFDGVSDISNDEFTGGTGGEYDGGTMGIINEEFDPDHTIPGDELGLSMREGVYEDTPETLCTINNETYGRIPGSFGSSSIDWLPLDVWYQEDPGGDIEAGTYNILFEEDAESSGDGEFVFDGLVVYDRRFHTEDDFDNEVHEPAGHLDRPYEYAESIQIELEEINTALSVSEATISTETSSDTASPELGLRQDGTGDYVTAEDTNEHTVAYEALSTTVQGLVSVGARPDLEARDATPRYGYESQTLETITIDANLDDTPVIVNRSFDGRLVDVLNEIADIGNFVWSVETDGGDVVINWTQLDQRQTDADPDLADYSIDRQTEDVVERAIVYGGASRVTRQAVDVTLGEWVDLPFTDSRLVEGRETIYVDDTEHLRGEDYEIRYVTADGVPQLRALEGGALSDGQTVQIDADVQPRGEFVQADVEDATEARTIVEDIPGLATQQMCDQVALYLVRQTGEALTEAEVTVPHSAVEWSVIEAIDVDQLPGGGPWQTREVESSASETTIRLADRQSAGEAVQDIRDRVSATERRS